MGSDPALFGLGLLPEKSMALSTGAGRGDLQQPVSIVYTDSIPLFALLFKILSPLLPANFQYFGLFELLSYALMGGFGALFVRAFQKEARSVCFLLSFLSCHRSC